MEIKGGIEILPKKKYIYNRALNIDTLYFVLLLIIVITQIMYIRPHEIV